MKKLIIVLLTLAISFPSFADDKVWTLQECISYAVAHNLVIRQQEDNVKQQEIMLSTSRNSRLPNLAGSVGESFNFGRALTVDNTYANRNTQSTNFSLSTSVPLFTGGQIPTDIKVKKLNLQAALQDFEKTRESVMLNVASTYLEAIYQKDLVEVAKRQVELSKAQVHRMELLFQNDKASEADLAQIRSTLASDSLSLTQQNNSYLLALLDLTQMLELETPEGFDVERPILSVVNEVTLPSPDVVYSEAVGIKPQILAEQTRLLSAQKNVFLAKSGLYPSLYFSAGLGTSYYKTSGYNTSVFGSQMRDNFSQYLGLSLSVPIFNRFSTRNNIRSARLQVHSQEIQLEETKKSLYKEIQQAYYNALAAQRQCGSSETALASAQTAFELMQRKYENGKATATEFQEAKTNLQKAESMAVQSRYTFFFRHKILEFYRSSDFS